MRNAFEMISLVARLFFLIQLYFLLVTKGISPVAPFKVGIRIKLRRIFVLSLFTALSLMILTYLRSDTEYAELKFPYPLRLIGISLVLLSNILMLWTIHAIFHRENLMKQNNGKFCFNVGPFRFIRFPIVSILGILFVGMLFSLNNWLLPIIYITVWPLIAFGALKFENKTAAEFGGIYDSYRSQTPGIVPNFFKSTFTPQTDYSDSQFNLNDKVPTNDNTQPHSRTHSELESQPFQESSEELVSGSHVTQSFGVSFVPSTESDNSNPYSSSQYPSNPYPSNAYSSNLYSSNPYSSNPYSSNGTDTDENYSCSEFLSHSADHSELLGAKSTSCTDLSCGEIDNT